MSAERYRIFETDAFLKMFGKTITVIEARMIRHKLDSLVYPELKIEPHFGPHIKKLRGYNPITYRYRIGGFRLFYAIDEKDRVVVMTAFRPRKDAYR